MSGEVMNVYDMTIRELHEYCAGRGTCTGCEIRKWCEDELKNAPYEWTLGRKHPELTVSDVNKLVKAVNRLTEEVKQLKGV